MSPAIKVSEKKAITGAVEKYLIKLFIIKNKFILLKVKN